MLLYIRSVPVSVNGLLVDCWSRSCPVDCTASHVSLVACCVSAFDSCVSPRHVTLTQTHEPVLVFVENHTNVLLCLGAFCLTRTGARARGRARVSQVQSQVPDSAGHPEHAAERARGLKSSAEHMTLTMQNKDYSNEHRMSTRSEAVLSAEHGTLTVQYKDY